MDECVRDFEGVDHMALEIVEAFVVNEALKSGQRSSLRCVVEPTARRVPPAVGFVAASAAQRVFLGPAKLG